MIITDAPIETEAIVRETMAPSCGAQVVFAGVVRDHNAGRSVSGIFYDCYRDMAEREIQSIAEEVKRTFDVEEIRVVHRVGELAIGDTSLLVVACGAHRKDAFDAVARVVEEIKQRAPIWKKERYNDAEERWL